MLPVAALLAACQTTTQPSAQTQPVAAPPVEMSVPRGQAMVYFYRPRAFAGSANTYRVSVNGTPVADIQSGTRYAAPVAPGPVTIEARTLANVLNFGLGLAMMEKPSLTITAQKDRVSYVKVTTGFGGGPSFAVVTAEQALGEMTGLNLAAAPQPE
jgi:hypothetical protein